MKTYLILLLFIFPILIVEAEEPRSLRLLTYNIHAGIGVDRKFDLERIAAVIKGAQPHVVALQEVDKETKRSKGVDIAKELAKLTGMKHLFGAAISIGGGEYGNAILTTLEIESSETFPIPRKVETEQRGLISANLVFEGETIQLLATHLCHRENDNRVTAAKFIAGKQAPANRTSFVMGDLNALPNSEPLLVLAKAGWRNPSTEPVFTFPVAEPNRQIDFVLYRSAQEKRVDVREIRVIDEKVASDHRPLLVVFSW